MSFRPEVVHFHALVVQADGTASRESSVLCDCFEEMVALATRVPDLPVPGEVPGAASPCNLRMVDAVFETIAFLSVCSNPTFQFLAMSFLRRLVELPGAPVHPSIVETVLYRAPTLPLPVPAVLLTPRTALESDPRARLFLSATPFRLCPAALPPQRYAALPVLARDQTPEASCAPGYTPFGFLTQDAYSSDHPTGTELAGGNALRPGVLARIAVSGAGSAALSSEYSDVRLAGVWLLEAVTRAYAELRPAAIDLLLNRSDDRLAVVRCAALTAASRALALQLAEGLAVPSSLLQRLTATLRVSLSDVDVCVRAATSDLLATVHPLIEDHHTQRSLAREVAILVDIVAGLGYGFAASARPFARAVFDCLVRVRRQSTATLSLFLANSLLVFSRSFVRDTGGCILGPRPGASCLPLAHAAVLSGGAATAAALLVPPRTLSGLLAPQRSAPAAAPCDLTEVCALGPEFYVPCAAICLDDEHAADGSAYMSRHMLTHLALVRLAMTLPAHALWRGQAVTVFAAATVEDSRRTMFGIDAITVYVEGLTRSELAALEVWARLRGEAEERRADAFMLQPHSLMDTLLVRAAGVVAAVQLRSPEGDLITDWVAVQKLAPMAQERLLESDLVRSIG